GLETAQQCMANGVLSNDNFTAIFGWPCVSQKPCKLCLLIKDQSDAKAWPCKYTFPQQCDERNQHARSDKTCSELLKGIEFLPWGTQTPAFGWS
ncbi:hypothetical protein PENTCL1PPCAC_12894, partial [Pristionchus entomophagus]